MWDCALILISFWTIRHFGLQAFHALNPIVLVWNCRQNRIFLTFELKLVGTELIKVGLTGVNEFELAMIYSSPLIFCLIVSSWIIRKFYQKNFWGRKWEKHRVLGSYVLIMHNTIWVHITGLIKEFNEMRYHVFLVDYIHQFKRVQNYACCASFLHITWGEFNCLNWRRNKQPKLLPKNWQKYKLNKHIVKLKIAGTVSRSFFIRAPP